MPFLQKDFMTTLSCFVHFLSLTHPFPVCSEPTEINGFENLFFLYTNDVE